MAQRPVHVGRLIVFVLALILIGLAVLANLHQDSRRQLGDRFGAALDAPSDEPLDPYFAPDAAVYLQGASTPMSPSALHEYIQRIKRQGQFLHRASKVYVTPTGFGWLLSIRDIRHTSGLPTLDDSPSPVPALWLESTIQNDRITRVWIHFTIEALMSTRQPVEAYRAAVAARHLPLPAAWEEGTPSLLAAAERADQQADTTSIVTSTVFGLGPVFVAILLAVVCATGLTQIRRKRPTTIGQLHDGRMLLKLRRARAASASAQESRHSLTDL